MNAFVLPRYERNTGFRAIDDFNAVSAMPILPVGDGRFLLLEQFSCYKRQPFLKTNSAKNTVQQILEQTPKQQSLCMAAYVLMPEHVHLLTGEPAKDTVATFLQILKQQTSRQLKSPDEKQFWQRRYYDFNVSSPEKYVEKLQYIHRNPVKRGLVLKPEDQHLGCNTGADAHSCSLTARTGIRAKARAVFPCLSDKIPACLNRTPRIHPLLEK